MCACMYKLESNNMVSTSCIGNLLLSQECSQVQGKNYYTIIAPHHISGAVTRKLPYVSTVTQSLEVVVLLHPMVPIKASTDLLDVVELRQWRYGGTQVMPITMMRILHKSHHTHHFTYGINWLMQWVSTKTLIGKGNGTFSKQIIESLENTAWGCAFIGDFNKILYGSVSLA